MADPYTHVFKFEVNGVFLRGECEFNTDDKSSFKISESSDPIDAEIFKDFCDFIKTAEVFARKYKMPEDGGLKKLIIRKKEK